MELVIGTILTTGQTLDDVLDMSWEQIKFCAGAITAHRTQMLEVVFDAISIGLGGKKSKKKVNNRRKKGKNQNKEEKRRKEALLVGQIQAAGFKI